MESVYKVSFEEFSSFNQHRVQPDQFIPDSKRDPYWYMHNITYWLSFFNVPLSYQYGNITGLSETNVGDYTFNSNPAAFMVKMILYYLGQQPNLDYNHLVQNVDTTNYQARWIKGQKIKDLVEKAKGTLMTRLSKAKFDAYPLSEDIVVKEEIERNLLDMQLYMKDTLAFMEEIGVRFQIADPTEVTDFDDVEDYMADYKHKTAKIYADLANGIYTTEGWASDCPRMYMYAYINSLLGVEHYMHNNKPCHNVIMPYHLLVDRRIDDDFGKYDEFRGWVKPVTINELLRLRPELLPYKDELYTLSSDADEYKRYSQLGYGRINWLCSGNSNMVSWAKVYWRGFKDIEEDLKQGNITTPIVPVEVINRSVGSTVYRVNGQIFNTPEAAEAAAIEATKASPYGREEIYQAELIAGRYLIRCKPADNVVAMAQDSTRLEFPILRFMPNMFLGQSMSEVARLHQLQDQLDMLDFKIMELIGKAKGRKYAIKSDTIAASPKEFIEDLATHDVIFTKSTGESDDENNRGRMVEGMDFTIDPMIRELNAIYLEREKRMENIASTSDVGLGQQGYYVGLGSQQQTIAQNNNGVAYLNDMFFDFMVYNMRYQCNMMKNFLASHPDHKYRALLGDGAMRFIQMNKDKIFDYVYVALYLEDISTEQQKARWTSILQAFSQNPDYGIDGLDILKLDMSNTPRVTIDAIERNIRKNKRDKQKREDAQMMQQAQVAQGAAQIEMQQTAMHEENENQRVAFKAEMDALTKGFTDAVGYVKQSMDIMAQHQLQANQAAAQGNGQSPPMNGTPPPTAG